MPWLRDVLGDRVGNTGGVIDGSTKGSLASFDRKRTKFGRKASLLENVWASGVTLDGTKRLECRGSQLVAPLDLV